MSDVVVRVEAPFLSVTKSVKLNVNSTVKDTVALLCDKVNAPNYLQYGLYLAVDQESSARAARTITSSTGWADPERTLTSYHVKNNDTIYLKRTPVELTVGLPDSNDRRTFMVDINAHVNDVVRDICFELDLKRPEDFSLEGHIDVLNRDTSLYAQGIKAGSICNLRMRKQQGGSTATSFARNVGGFLTQRVAPTVDLFRTKASNIEFLAARKNSAIPGNEQAAANAAAAPVSSAGTGGSAPSSSPSQQPSAKLFGAPLEQGVKVGANPYEIPLMVERVIQFVETNHMDTEGIFRLSGGTSMLNSLKERFNRGEDVDLSNVTDPHAVTGVLKMYLRELPEPLLTFDRFDLFIGIATPRAAEGDMRHRYYRAIVRTLPRPNYIMIKRLIGFLANVAEHRANNKMGTVNLATVFGPNLLKERNESVLQAVENTSIVAQVVDDLINMYKKVFEHTGKETKFTHFVRTLFAFNANTPMELSFPDRALICVTNCDSSDGWWEGELMGIAGLFPENHAEVLMDLRNVECNDDASVASRRLRDDLQTIQKQLKEDLKARKETEDQVIALVTRFQALEQRLIAAESAFRELSRRKAHLERGGKDSEFVPAGDAPKTLFADNESTTNRPQGIVKSVSNNSDLGKSGGSASPRKTSPPSSQHLSTQPQPQNSSRSGNNSTMTALSPQRSLTDLPTPPLAVTSVSPSPSRIRVLPAAAPVAPATTAATDTSLAARPPAARSPPPVMPKKQPSTTTSELTPDISPPPTVPKMSATAAMQPLPQKPAAAPPTALTPVAPSGRRQSLGAQALDDMFADLQATLDTM